MKEELDKKLCETYPKIFRDRHAPMTQTAMCWGFDCGDGWYNIINKLCKLIQNHIDYTDERIEWCKKFNEEMEQAKQNNWEGWNPAWIKTSQEIPKPISQVVAVQVKEKFGTLRFYYDGGDDYIDGAVAMAEMMSSVTCEVCGKPGKSNDTGWIRTVCEEHKKENV